MLGKMEITEKLTDWLEQWGGGGGGRSEELNPLTHVHFLGEGGVETGGGGKVSVCRVKRLEPWR